MYPETGAILVTDITSPKATIDRGWMPEEWTEKDGIPLLESWSDVSYLVWRGLTTDDQRSNLRYVGHDTVMNDETKELLAKALQLNFPDDLNPGRAPNLPETRVISSGMPGFDALLRAPNVRGTIWLLLQHQDDFAGKTIQSIEVRELLLATVMFADQTAPGNIGMVYRTLRDYTLGWIYAPHPDQARLDRRN